MKRRDPESSIQYLPFADRHALGTKLQKIALTMNIL